MADRSRAGRVLGAVAGVVLLPAAIGLLAWNEGHGADRGSALAEGAVAVREAPPDRPDPALEGRLIHVSGPLRVPGTLADPDLAGVRAPPGAVQLRRLVQTYQWQERSGRGSTSYVQLWSDQVVDSTRLRQPGGPRNPPPRFQALQVVAPEASLGAYRLTESLLRALGGAEPLAVTAEVVAGQPGLRRDGAGLYLGGDPAAPRIGDQRLSWEVVRASSASVVARLRGAEFVPYRAASGASLYEIAPGVLSAAEMIATAEEENRALTWFLRAAGAGLLSLCLFLLLRVRQAPVIRGMGPAMAAGVLTAMAAPAVVAAAWLVAGEWVAAGLLALVPVLAWVLVRRVRLPA